MQRVLLTSVLLLLFSTLSVPGVAVAGGDGITANGSYQISLETGQSRDIQFDARVATDGNTTGEITFRDAGAVVIDPKTTAEGETSEALPPFYAKAACDCLVVNGVEAVLSGTVTESSRKNFIGRRVLLVVQDGDRFRPALRDKLTYGFYRTVTYDLGATDLERPDQETVPGWVSTDFERPDDVGILSKKNEEVTCTSFPISSFAFLGAKQGKGQIQVTH